MNQSTRLFFTSWLRWLVPAAWMGVIFWFSSRTGDDLGEWLPEFQKVLPFLRSFDVGHFAAFFILALTLEYAFGKRAFLWRGKCVIVLICLLYGITDEFHQRFVPGRMPDAADVLSDTVGAIAAVIFTALPPISRRWKRWIG